MANFEGPKTHQGYKSAGRSDETIAVVMTAAHQVALQLVGEGMLTSATLSDETGEASCLTLVVPGEALPFYVQPMWPDADEYGEACVELYVEREDAEWEPVPFAVRINEQDDMEDDLGALSEFVRLMCWFCETVSRQM